MLTAEANFNRQSSKSMSLWFHRTLTIPLEIGGRQVSTDKDADGFDSAAAHECAGNNEKDCASNVTRRALLKMAAGAPLLLTFGMLASPLSRFFKPSMTPGNFFQASDFSEVSAIEDLKMADFPSVGDHKLIEVRVKSTVFGAAKEQIRVIPAVALRLDKDKIVAFSRLCPVRACVMQFTRESCCGCTTSQTGSCNCHAHRITPVLVCHEHYSVFDLTNGGLALAGRYCRTPREFLVRKMGEQIVLDGFAYNWIT